MEHELMPGPTRAGVRKQLQAMAASFRPGAQSLVDQAGFAGNYDGSGMSPLMRRSAMGWGMDPALGAPLPRDPRVFLSQMDPNYPQPPTSLDPRGPSGRPLPRLNQYPISWNLPSPPGTFKMVPFKLMRNVADMSHVARRCIEIRQKEIADVDFEVAPKEEERGQFKIFPDKKAGLFDQWRSERKTLQTFFENPDPVRGLHYRDWISMAVEDILVTDSLSVFEEATWGPTAGVLGSDLRGLTIIDGSTIKPLLDIRGGPPAPPNPAYQQFIWGLPRVDLVSLVMDAREDPTVQDAQRGFSFSKAEYIELTRDQLAYLPFTPRSWTAYGYSNIERAILLINIALKRLDYHSSYFTDGDIPAMLLYVPETWTLDQVNKYEAQWHAKTAGSQSWKHRMNVVPGAVTADQLKPPQYDMTFDDYVDRAICGAMMVDPTEAGIEPKGGLGGSGYMEAQDDRRKRLTVGPALRKFKSYFDGVISRRVGLDALEVRYDGLDVEDEAEEHKIDIERLQRGTMSPNQYRQKRGEPRILKPDGSEDSNGDRMYFVMSREVIGLDQVGTKNLDDQAAEQLQAKTQQQAQGNEGGAVKAAESDEEQPTQKSASDEVDAFERFLRRPRARRFASDVLPNAAIDAVYKRLDGGEGRRAVFADLRKSVIEGSEMLASEVADAILERLAPEASGSLR
jgi:hypothetical protein